MLINRRKKPKIEIGEVKEEKAFIDTIDGDDFKLEPNITVGFSRTKAQVKAIKIRDSVKTNDSWKIRGFEHSSDALIDSHRSDNSYSSRAHHDKL